MAAWQANQTSERPRTVPGTPRNTIPTAPTSAPPSTQGLRRPQRDVVRSESAPASGLKKMEANAPAPAIQASAVSLLSGATSWASRGRRLWIGVKNAIVMPRFTSATAPM